MSLLSDIVELNRLAKLQPDYQLIDYNPVLLPMLTPRGTDSVFFDNIAGFATVLTGFAEMGPAYMATHKGQVICAFGCIPLWPGVGECWLLTDVSLPEHRRPFHRVTKLILDSFMSELNLIRLQITVHSENVLAHKWAKVLYFKQEGVLKRFGPDGKDFYMLART